MHLAELAGLQRQFLPGPAPGQQHSLCMGHQPLALVGQLDIVAIADKQLHAEYLLQLPYAGTYCGLGEIEVFRGLAEVPCAPYLEKCLEHFVIHASARRYVPHFCHY